MAYSFVHIERIYDVYYFVNTWCASKMDEETRFVKEFRKVGMFELGIFLAKVLAIEQKK